MKQKSRSEASLSWQPRVPRFYERAEPQVRLDGGDAAWAHAYVMVDFEPAHPALQGDLLLGS